MPFSRETRKVINERDQVCVVCGCAWGECSHVNHDRSSPEYDLPENGHKKCAVHHLEEHVERAGENGLSIADNNCAIQSLLVRIIKGKP